MYYNTRIWLLSLIDSSFCIKACDCIKSQAFRDRVVEKHPFMVVFAEFDFTYIHKSDGGYKKEFFWGK